MKFERTQGERYDMIMNTKNRHWIENHALMRWIRINTKLIVAVTIVASVLMCLLIYWGLAPASSTDPVPSFIRYAIVIIVTLTVSTAIITQGWVPLILVRRYLPIMIRANKESLIIKSANQERTIPWKQLEGEKAGSFWTGLRNPEVLILKDVIRHRGTPRRFLHYGWDWTNWDKNVIAEIQNGYMFYRSNLRKLA